MPCSSQTVLKKSNIVEIRPPSRKAYFLAGRKSMISLPLAIVWPSQINLLIMPFFPLSNKRCHCIAIKIEPGKFQKINARIKISPCSLLITTVPLGKNARQTAGWQKSVLSVTTLPFLKLECHKHSLNCFATVNYYRSS